MTKQSVASIALLSGALLITSCNPNPTPETQAGSTEQSSLKDAFGDAFLVGTSINRRQSFNPSAIELALITSQFNSIAPENVLKWERVHPEPGRYDFEGADRYVAFGEEHGMIVTGHTLIWHSQTPRWVFEDGEGNPTTRDTLLARMRDHIMTVVGRYKGRISEWDVVNEPFNDDGTLRQSPWRQIIGDDYIAKAFEFAYEADPEARLYLNDYSLPNRGRRVGAVSLIRTLQEDGVPITGIGMQGHYNLTFPTAGQLDSSIAAFGALGLDVMITEFDVDVLPPAIRGQGADIADRAAYRKSIDPYTDALPDSVQQLLADQYASWFRVLVDHADIVTRVTFWGLTDGDNWKNNWPVPGRTNYPVLFDRNHQPKPAYYAVMDTAPH